MSDPLSLHEKINHPPHYTKGGIEAISVIEAWNLNFHLGCVLKYICRYEKKDGSPPINDLMKARWYLDRLIQKVLGPPNGEGLPKEEESKPAKPGSPMLTTEDRDFMLEMANDLWKLTADPIANRVNSRFKVGAVIGAGDRIARAVSSAFQKAFREQFGQRTEDKEDAT